MSAKPKKWDYRPTSERFGKYERGADGWFAPNRRLAPAAGFCGFDFVVDASLRFTGEGDPCPCTLAWWEIHNVAVRDQKAMTIGLKSRNLPRKKFPEWWKLKLQLEKDRENRDEAYQILCPGPGHIKVPYFDQPGTNKKQVQKGFLLVSVLSCIDMLQCRCKPQVIMIVCRYCVDNRNDCKGFIECEKYVDGKRVSGAAKGIPKSRGSPAIGGAEAKAWLRENSCD